MFQTIGVIKRMARALHALRALRVFTRIKLGARVLPCVRAMARIKWRRLLFSFKKLLGEVGR